MDVYDFISGDDSKPAVSSRAMNAVQALAKSKAEAEKEQLKYVANLFLFILAFILLKLNGKRIMVFLFFSFAVTLFHFFFGSLVLFY